MKITENNALTEGEKDEILLLWNAEYPISFRYANRKAFEDYLNNLTDQRHLLIKDELGKVQGWYFDFIRDNDRWFVIILDETLHGKGFGSKLLKVARQTRSTLNGWVLTGQYKKHSGEDYKSPLMFYQKNGFRILKDVKVETDQFSTIKISWREPIVSN